MKRLYLAIIAPATHFVTLKRFIVSGMDEFGICTFFETLHADVLGKFQSARVVHLYKVLRRLATQCLKLLP